MLPVIGELRPWADPAQVQMHRLPMHVPLTGFERRVLDGRWRIEMFAHPDRVPAAALVGDRAAAVSVDVPGNWTVQDLGGFVDLPHYTNVQMPFPGPPPRLPERNATGVYRRSFSLPAHWLRRRCVLHIGGAESVHAVYVNGRFAGYGTDSRLPSEYDVGRFLVRGRNDVAIVVVRYSAQSYVEDQDQWWMAGLHRSVWLESRPPVHLADLPVAVGYDPVTGSGSVAVTGVVDFGGSPDPGWIVRSSLRGPNGRRVGRVIAAEVPHVAERPYVFEGFRTTARWNLRRARAWSAEQPDRYSVTAELVDSRGKVHHSETQMVGVRSVEVHDRQLLVNGQPVWIFGVNRHDHHPDRGKAVTVDDIRADLVTMRAHNITAVRTSHYPNDSAFYDLCDELGFYVFDEANIESHAYNTSLCDDPSYRTTWLERGARMVERDRNHPCVISWSLGNESGHGVNHDALAAWIRTIDPTLPLHHEGEILHRGWVGDDTNVSDIVGPMYPSIDDIREYGVSAEGQRPLIMSEYSHAMGNSNGSLADYWDVITSTPGLQGGFVWEWKDQVLRQRTADGGVRLAHGGQFGDTPHDGNFVADGLVSAELDPHPAMRELAWVYRPVTVERRRGDLMISNRQSFADLSGLRARWELQVGDEVARGGVLRVPRLGPRSSVPVPVPCHIPETEHEVVLSIRWETRHETWFAPAGHLVAWDQVVLGRQRRVRRVPVPEHGSIADDLVTPRLNLWRAATDNDGFKLMPEKRRRRAPNVALRDWQEAGIDVRPADELVDHEVRVEQGECSTVYRHVVDVPVALADLPRIGVSFELPKRFDRVRWSGRGPHENYPDRNRSAMLGVWEGPPDESPYAVPQEFGLRTDCRWFEVIDSTSGQVVRIDALRPSRMHVSAVGHTAADLFAAANATELPPSDRLVVCIDTADRGLGTASCGPDVLPRYRLRPGRYEFSYRVATHERRY